MISTNTKSDDIEEQQKMELDADLELARQAEMMMFKGVKYNPKGHLIKKVNTKWDSADHYLKQGIETQMAVDADNECARQCEMLLNSQKVKNKKPLIKKERIRWDSGDHFQNQYLQNDRLQKEQNLEENS